MPMDECYEPRKIEPYWQAEWDRADLYLTREDRDRPKFYVLEMFPYPSGDGLSVGHLHNYVPCDVIGRYKRMAGYSVLHAMGWDAFGLPAENDALLKGLHPKETVPRYAANFKRQLKLVGCAYDWTREINSSTPEYYRWTQWFFLLMLKRGLAFRAISSQWWCEKCRTVLANEQVINGCCWRHTDTPVTKKDLEQWFFRITAYADRLLDDLEGIDWPEPIKLMQRNWVGRSEGAELAFPVEGHPGKEVRFFTTRPDTVFGVSFMVLAPEHPLVAEVTTAQHRPAVEEYVTQARRQSEIERLSTVKEKTGVFIGAYARNLFNDKLVPIFIADYVLMGYGTGAIMGAPGEDQRDYEFATKYGLGGSVGHRARRRQSAARRPRVLRLRHQYQFVQRRTQPQRDEDRRRDPRRVQVRRGARDRPLDRDLPDARLAHLTPALLGMSDPDRLLSARRYRAGSRRSASGPACPT